MTGPPHEGMRVRFLINNLGASLRNDLSHTVEEVFGLGDAGTVVFQHSNVALRSEGWWYVEVARKVAPGLALYVGVTPEIVEEVWP